MCGVSTRRFDGRRTQELQRVDGRRLASEGTRRRSTQSVSTTIKAEIQVNEGKISKYAELVHSKKEYRSVECAIEWDFKKKQKRIVRNDTGEVVRTTTVTEAEMQEELGVPDKVK